MLMDRILERVAISSVPLARWVSEGNLFPFGGEGFFFFVAEYISIHQQAERSLVHHILCCRKTYGLGCMLSKSGVLT